MPTVSSQRRMLPFTLSAAGGLDSEAWTTEPGEVPGAGSASEESLRLLHEAGWTALTVPRGASLTDLWRQADRQRTGAMSGNMTEGRS